MNPQQGGNFMSYINQFIKEIKEKPLEKILTTDLYTATPKNTASIDDIIYSEEKLGFKLPESYKKFVTEYSNGDFFMLGVEPICGVGPQTPETLAKLFFPFQVFFCSPEKEILIKPENRTVKLNQLISFTYQDVLDISNDHWVFICDKKYPNNDYPVGYISQNTHNIVYTLKNFEEWLKVFWDYNKALETDYLPVFHIFFPTQDDSDPILRELED